LQLAQWFLRRRLKCEMLTDGRRTTDDGRKVMTIAQHSQKARWAKKCMISSTCDIYKKKLNSYKSLCPVQWYFGQSSAADAKFFKQGNVAPRKKSSLQKFYGCHHNLVDIFVLLLFLCLLLNLVKQQWTIKISPPLFSIFSLVAILVGSRNNRTQIWKGAIQGPFHQRLVAIGPVVSKEKIKMWNVDGRTTDDGRQTQLHGKE
jgi:hypothetical protein